MRVSFNWLRDYVQIKGSHEKLANQLTMVGLEVKRVESVSDDYILETEITTNRPDWLSHIGVAREIHAVTGCQFSIPPYKNKMRSKTNREFRISVVDPKLCPYYSAVMLEGVRWGK